MCWLHIGGILRFAAHDSRLFAVDVRLSACVHNLVCGRNGTGIQGLIFLPVPGVASEDYKGNPL